MPANWKWWEQKQRWEVVFDQLCEKVRWAGHEPTREEITTIYMAEYKEIYWHFQSVEELLDKIVWRVWDRKRVRPELERIATVVVAKMTEAAVQTVLNFELGGEAEMAGKSLTREEAMQKLRRMTEELGHIPKQTEMQGVGVAWATLIKYLGPRAGWEELLKEESAPVPQGGQEEDVSEPQSGSEVGTGAAEVRPEVTAEGPAEPEAERTTVELAAMEKTEVVVTGTAELKVRIGERDMLVCVKLGETI